MTITSSSGIRNPTSLKPSETFKAYSTDVDNFKMDESTYSLIVTCDKEAGFTNISVTRQLAEINLVTDYVFSFKTTNVIPSSGYLILQIPKESVILSPGF